MQVREILDIEGGASPLSVPATLSLLDAAGKLRASRSGALAVVEDGVLVGVLSESAIVNALAMHGPAVTKMIVAEAMMPALVTCSMDDSVGETLIQMCERGAQEVPVLSNGRPVAMLTSREFRSACCVLEAQAETDDLTGLTNRRGLLPEIVNELGRYHRYCEPVTLAMLDLDLLKNVNDRLGHAAGDALLRLVAGALTRETRSCDKVARIGGDEFALLLPQTRLFEAVVACKRILRACRHIPVPMIEGVGQVTLSIGVAMAQIGDTAETILQRADQGLYEAKAAGRGKVVAMQPPAQKPADAPPFPRHGAAPPFRGAARLTEDQSLAFSANS